MSAVPARRTARSRDAGDTLIEVLVAVTIIGIVASGIIGGLASTIATSGTHRSVATLDAIVRSFAEKARYDIQLAPTGASGGPLFSRCASSYPIASAAYPGAGPVGTPVTVFVTGLAPASALSVTVGGAGASVTSPTPAVTSSTGSATVVFVIPSGATSPQVVVSDTHGARATTTVTIGGSPPASDLGPPISGYQVSLRSVSYWSGTSFTSSCNPSSATSDLQQLTMIASGPGANDQLNVAVANPRYVPTPTIAVRTAPAAPTVGNTLSFTAVVTPPVSGPAPTGTLSWVIGVSTGTAPNCTTTTALASDANPANPYEVAATCTVSGALAATYTASASYGGDAHYNTASGSGTVTVARAIPAVSVPGSPASPTYGSTLTFTATVTPPTGGVTPTGTVAWTIAAPAGSAPTCANTNLNGGVTSCSISNAVVGSYSVVASYQGDGNYFAATGSSNTLTVPKVAPTVTVDGAPSNPVYGATITFTATVSPASGAPTPTGTVTWSIAVTTGTAPTCAASTLSGSGTATCSVTGATVRSYTATATYAGNATYLAAAATGNTLTVPKLTPTLVVVGTPANPTTGSTLTFTATVTGATGGPTLAGALAWSGVACTTTTPLAVNGVTATATCTVASALPGLYTATAAYTADASYTNATGANNPLTVAKAIPGMAVSGSPASPVYASTLTFTATLSPSSGGPNPTGSVTWTITSPSGTTPTCAASTLTGGVATCTVANAVPGGYGVTATYAGDGNYLGASASSATLSVPKVTPTVTIVGTPANPTYASTVTFTATVTPAGGAPTPTGTLTWTLTGTTATCATSTLTASGRATCTVANVTPGSYTASATYQGDTIYTTKPGTSNTLTVPKLLPGSITVVGTPANPTYGASLTFTATVAASSGAPTPTGTLTWTLTGTAATCAPSTLSGTGTATCTVTGATPGSYTATANYQGDATYSAAMGATSLTVAKLTLGSLSVADAPANPVYGATLTFTATVTAASGGPTPAGTVTWTLTGTAATCGSSTLSGSGTATCTVTGATPGSYTATANYQGDATYSAQSASGPALVVAPLTPASVVLTSALVNGTLTFTATVNPASGGPTPTGTVAWVLTGTTATCTPSTLGGGVTSCSVTGAARGTYTVTATYQGDATYAALASPTLTVRVATWALASAKSGNGANEKLIFTATLTIPTGGPSPTGAVAWAITGNATSCTGGTTALTGAPTIYTATCTVSNSKNNTYNATASYTTDAIYVPATASQNGVAG